MDENTPSRVNNSTSDGRHPVHRSGVPKHHLKHGKNKFKLVFMSIGAVLLFAGLSLGVLLAYKSNTNSSIDNNRYQAVFLSNGQVYFGKLHTYNGDYMKLTNIYYLQTKSSSTSSTNPQKTSSQDESNVQLIKLGSEIHGPDDEMIVSKEQILFFENLKKDSQVSASIDKYSKPN